MGQVCSICGTYIGQIREREEQCEIIFLLALFQAYIVVPESQKVLGWRGLGRLVPTPLQ